MAASLERLRLDKEFWVCQQQELEALFLPWLDERVGDEDFKRKCHFYIDLLRRSIEARARDEARRRM